MAKKQISSYLPQGPGDEVLIQGEVPADLHARVKQIREAYRAQHGRSLSWGAILTACLKWFVENDDISGKGGRPS